MNTGALWNYAYYINVAGDTFENCKFCIIYDLDPDTGTPESEMGIIDINGGVVFFGGSLPATTLVQDSQNLLFAHHNGGLPFITAPSHTPFDPDVEGEYNIALVAKDASDNEIGRAEIVVEVLEPR